jgi:hypothetical protein
MWTYRQKTGEMLDDAGTIVGVGYAGHGPGVNNPLLQYVANLGPLPTGIYDIAPPVDTDTHGPYVLWLSPRTTNDMRGRFGFGIHSDRKDFEVNPRAASTGCIIQSLDVREQMWNSGDHVLRVVSGF